MIDPIQLAQEPTAQIGSMGRIAGIVVTNENHERAAAQFAETFKAPIYRNGPFADGGLTIVRIEGGPAGEIAVHSNNGNGTMVIGDALINFEPYGFTLLPPKYCTHAKLMRRSLAQLLDYSFERMFFAHGMPILSSARKQLESLLNEHR